MHEQAAEFQGEGFPPDVAELWEANQAEHDRLVRERADVAARDNLLRRLASRPGNLEGGAGPSGRAPVEDSGWSRRDEQGNWRPMRPLRYGERMSVLDGPGAQHPRLSWRKYLRGITTGNWQGAPEERSMAEGTGSAGGFLVPTPLSDMVIDRARAQVVCMRAGATVVPMDAATLAIARVTGDPTVTPWHSEAGAIVPSDLTFDRVTFTARTLGAIATLSVELAEDAANADDVISNALAKVMAVELDRACLRGSGTPPEPTGIRFQAGVGVDTTTFGANGATISGTTPAGAVGWDWMSRAIFVVRGLNEYPNAAIFSERSGGELDLLRSSTGAPLPPPISVAGAEAEIQLPGAEFSGLGSSGLQLLSTNSVSNALTQGTSVGVSSSCYIGDFQKLLIGMRRELVLEISRTASAPSATSMFSTMQVAIRAYIRADVQLLRPAAFRVVEGIL